jgi:hypothetical protein
MKSKKFLTTVGTNNFINNIKVQVGNSGFSSSKENITVANETRAVRSDHAV